MNPTADIGVIALAVMGENLALNFAGRNFTTATVDTFMTEHAAGKPLIGCRSIEEFAAARIRRATSSRRRATSSARTPLNEKPPAGQILPPRMESTGS